MANARILIVLGVWGVVGMLSAPAADRYVVKDNPTPVHPYTSWANAAAHIQDAVDAAAVNDTVWVGPGRYTLPPNPTNYWGTNVVFVNRFLTLRSSNGVPDSVIIDGEGQYRCLTLYHSGNNTNRYILDGVTISNGVATNGAGLLLQSLNTAWTAVVQNCVFTHNTAFSPTGTTVAGGGALYNYNTSSGFGFLISNCVFRANVSYNTETETAASGGAIKIRNAGLKSIVDSLFEDNVGGQQGGAVSSEHGVLSIERSVFRRNRTTAFSSSSSGGGALNMASSSLDCRNSLFHDNWTYGSGNGGAIANSYQTKAALVNIVNTTIVSNRAAFGGGIYIRPWSDGVGGNASLQIYNSIIQSNTAGALTSGYNVSARPSTDYTNYYIHSCWYPTNGAGYSPSGGGFVEIGSVTSAPGFANFAMDDFHLAGDSPCLNAGTNLSELAGTTDLERNPRIDTVYGIVDLGCYERKFHGTLIMMR